MSAGKNRSEAAGMNRQAGFLRLLAVLTALVLLSACGYRFAGSGGNRLASGQSLWVSFIGVEANNSPSSAQTVLRRALLDEGHALRGLSPSGSAESADLRVKGALKSYASRAMSYTALDQVREYRLAIEVELELYRRGETAPLWKGTLQSYQDYPSNKDLSLQRSAEEAALAAASQILARKFLMAVEQSY